MEYECMDDVPQCASRFLRHITSCVAVATCVYIGTYFLFMVRHSPAFSDSGQILFDSSCRWGRVDFFVRPGGTTVEAYRVTVFNYFYYPLDVVYYAMERTISPKGASQNY